MVFPGDELCVTLQHTGVVSGRKVVTVQVHKLRGTRELVMRGRAEVEQPKTAYLFTGQASCCCCWWWWWWWCCCSCCCCLLLLFFICCFSFIVLNK